MSAELENDLPRNQFIAPEEVMMEMAEAGAKRACRLSVPQVLVLCRHRLEKGSTVEPEPPTNAGHQRPPA